MKFRNAITIASFFAVPFTFAESKYWAYQPVRPVTPPEIAKRSVENPIDAFLLAGLRDAGIEPVGRAGAVELRRRLSYDLTGLPPKAGTSEWTTLVDRYLASPRFGEKFASHWLDLVRYAETNGFERDSEKPEIWRYRDYVIRSFNEDKPYDRFIIEQLAGDQLADRTLETCLATGFLTLMQRDDEPADKPQAHADVISNIVDVTSEAFMGTTLGCAKCHDHKADPIRQADYFSMRSFFAGIKQDLFKQANHTWIDPEVSARREEKRRENEAGIAEAWREVDQARLEPFLKKSPDPGQISLVSQIRQGLAGDPGWSLPSFDAAAGGFQNGVEWTRGKPMVLRSEFRLSEVPPRFLVYLKGSMEKLEIFLNGVPVHEGVVELVDGEAFVPVPVQDLTTGKNALGIVVTSRRGPVEIRVTRDPVRDLNANQLAAMHPALLARTYGEEFEKKMTVLQERQRELERPVEGIRYLGVHEKETIPPPVIHRRGNVHVSGNEVPVAFPAALDREGLQPERTRLAAAQWVTSPDHPLTARVWVNRLWQYCFGTGLVETANDFGRLGTGVSNQALLDWLAGELVRSGWSTKHMLRLMLTSEAYQRSSRGTNDQDPANRLLWKSNSRRLTAEEIWDTYLVLTREMKFDLGGPPVRPKMPDAVLATSSRPDSVWRPSPGDSANRRAVYIHVKRSIKLPLLANFDSPERDLSCPSRFSTIVPTQSLTMLNSERMNQFSDSFADRLEGSLEEKIATAFRLATSRDMTDGELHEMMGLARDLREKYDVPGDQVMSRICLLILNLNETLYLD